MSPEINTLGQFGNGKPTGGTPADLPELDAFPLEIDGHKRLVGLQADRTLVYHRPECELHIYDPSDFESGGELAELERANTSSFSTHQFDSFRSEMQDRDWFATTDYAGALLGDVDIARYPVSLPSEADQQSNDRPGERLLGIDAWGLGHYEVHEVDVPFIRRYAPFKSSEIIRWEPMYEGYVTPDTGLAHRHIAHYIVTTAVEQQGWEFLSEYGQSLASDYLAELEPVRELLE